MKRLALIVVLVLCPVSLFSQGKEPKATLTATEQVDVQIRLQEALEGKAQAELEAAALRVQLRALSGTVDALLAEAAQPKVKEADAQRKALAEKLIEAFGGDPAKGDTWDWSLKQVIKKSGDKGGVQ